VSAMGRFLVQRSPTECGVSECDREALIIRRSWPIGAVATCEVGKGNKLTLKYEQLKSYELHFRHQ
jgi:hypothetical protein